MSSAQKAHSRARCVSSRRRLKRGCKPRGGSTELSAPYNGLRV
jgi:hypothetical protein